MKELKSIHIICICFKCSNYLSIIHIYIYMGTLAMPSSSLFHSIPCSCGDVFLSGTGHQTDRYLLRMQCETTNHHTAAMINMWLSMVEIMMQPNGNRKLINIIVKWGWSRRYRSISFVTIRCSKDIDRYLFYRKVFKKISIDIFFAI